MRILLLHDRRAGHANQARAICMALARAHQTEVEEIFVKPRSGLFQKLLTPLQNRTGGRLPEWLFQLSHVLEKAPERRPDLIVSAGGSTRFANAAWAHRFNCANLFCGSLRGLSPELFDGVVTAYEHLARGKPFILSPTPVPIDREGLEKTAAEFNRRTGRAGLRYWSLLVGGAGGGYTYTSRDWKELAAGMTQLARRHEIKWLVSTSRRTGSKAEKILATCLDPELTAARCFVSMQQDEISYREILALAERHFCTEDSHMMISEAIATGRPVCALSPRRFATAPPNRHFLELYEARRWLVRHPIRDVGGIRFDSAEESRPQAPGVLDELATRLEAWWERLPGAR